MKTEEKVQPTYVILSPFFFQNNKTVKFVAKHGQLWFVVLFSICMTLFYLNRKDNCWVLYLPQIVFYSIFYVFQRNLNNKNCQLMLALISNIFILYTFYLTLFLKCNSVQSENILKLFSVASSLLYPLFLHIDLRKLYTKDLSTPRKVFSLNTIDCCLSLLFMVCFLVSVPVMEFLRVLFPLDASFSLSHEELFIGNALEKTLWACGLTYGVGLIVGLYVYVTYSNRTKRMTSLYEAEIDCNGRAWWSASHMMFLVFTLLKYRCEDCYCALGRTIGWNRSSVKPEESQKLSLKPIADLNV